MIYSKYIILLSVFFIAIISSPLFFTLTTNQNDRKEEEPKVFCGTLDPPSHRIDRSFMPDEFKYKGRIDGKALFKANCASCHAQNMLVDATGPALGGIVERWRDRETLLIQWIRNSQTVITSGDTYAVNLYNKWDKSTMTSFPNLKDDEIKAIITYIETGYSFY